MLASRTVQPNPEQLAIEMQHVQLAMEIREERQAASVADVVEALIAVTRPIIVGVLYSIGSEYLSEYEGDRGRVPLKMLGRLRKESDGDAGLAFEYAIHDAILTSDPVVTERVAEALKLCRITGGDPASILFAIEKQGSKQLISRWYLLPRRHTS